MLVTVTVMVSSNLAGVAVGGLTFSADSDTLAVTMSSDSLASLPCNWRHQHDIHRLLLSMTVDGVGGEGVAVRVGVCVSVKKLGYC